MNLPKTAEVLKRLGFETEGIEYMLGQIARVLNQYPDPEKAVEQFEATFSGLELSRFGEKQFRAFLRDICPGSYHRSTLDYLEKEDTDEMDEEELREHRKAIAGFKELQHEESQTQLLDPYQYDALTRAHFRASKRHEVGPLPTASFILVPTGGQQGFRRKRRIA